MSERKPNQGMRSPQFGGIGSRVADARVTANVCRHPPEDHWRERGGGKWICGICHPPALPASQIEWVGDTFRPLEGFTDPAGRPVAFVCGPDDVDESGGVADD